jgi:hypothetical protein
VPVLSTFLLSSVKEPLRPIVSCLSGREDLVHDAYVEAATRRALLHLVYSVLQRNHNVSVLSEIFT